MERSRLFSLEGRSCRCHVAQCRMRWSSCEKPGQRVEHLPAVASAAITTTAATTVITTVRVATATATARAAVTTAAVRHRGVVVMRRVRKCGSEGQNVVKTRRTKPMSASVAFCSMNRNGYRSEGQNPCSDATRKKIQMEKGLVWLEDGRVSMEEKQR